MPEGHDVTLRRLKTREDYDACVRLQREIWGEDFVDVVPATILMVSQRVGGVTAGAFDGSGRLLGFVFGISGVSDGQPTHWSDMLAVRPEARGHGLGKQLKLFQRDRLLDEGINVVYWSYDPLVAANAHFNLNVLGAIPKEYVVNMYGDTRSTLHRGLETDRLIVEWRLPEPGPRRDPNRPSDETLASIANPVPSGRISPDPDAPPPRASPVRISIPADIEGLKQTSGDEARTWQLSVRRAFRWYLDQGYEVVAFHRAADGETPWYTLNHPEMGTSG